ncbi:MAG: hypothetical protein ACRD0A_17160 [Acidimicrobiales bacterium]
MSEDDLSSPAPQQEFPRKQAIAALAANLAVLVFCFPLGGLVGTVVAGIGLSRTATRPDSARTLVRWAWIVCGVSVAVSLVLLIWTIATNPSGSDASP